jgi:DUF1365 family protein
MGAARLFGVAFVFLIAGAASILAALFVLPWLLAGATWIRHRCRRSRRKRRIGRSQDEASIRLEEALGTLKLYQGRVWHTRFRPVRHAFTYPLFILGVDLSALDALGRRMLARPTSPSYVARDCDAEEALRDALWPLSCILRFRTSDHLKNGEGSARVADAPTGEPSVVPTPFLERIQNLLRSEAAKQVRGDGKQDQPHPRRDDWDLIADGSPYRVVLITHLCYYGYCFNPVSFYLVVDDRFGDANANPVRAVVGEVSNTPWGEMHCYVLLRDQSNRALSSHKDTSGRLAGHDTSLDAACDNPTSRVLRNVRYIFPKAFHVSPFMEMHYDYDWTFGVDARLETFDIHNSLVCKEAADGSSHAAAAATTNHDSDSDDKCPDESRTHSNTSSTVGKRQFHARMLVRSAHDSTTSLWSIAWQLSCYPAFGMIVQAWIHYQALWLFLVRGVDFQPHPQGTETSASRIIGAVMSPYFALRERLDDRSRRLRQREISAATAPGSNKKRQ